jgi:hypothetical protein
LVNLEMQRSRIPVADGAVRRVDDASAAARCPPLTRAPGPRGWPSGGLLGDAAWIMDGPVCSGLKIWGGMREEEEESKLSARATPPCRVVTCGVREATTAMNNVRSGTLLRTYLTYCLASMSADGRGAGSTLPTTLRLLASSVIDLLTFIPASWLIRSTLPNEERPEWGNLVVELVRRSVRGVKSTKCPLNTEPCRQ